MANDPTTSANLAARIIANAKEASANLEYLRPSASRETPEDWEDPYAEELKPIIDALEFIEENPNDHFFVNQELEIIKKAIGLLGTRELDPSERNWVETAAACIDKIRAANTAGDPDKTKTIPEHGWNELWAYLDRNFSKVAEAAREAMKLRGIEVPADPSETRKETPHSPDVSA